MSRDIIVSCFASSAEWQPFGEFEDKPHVIDVGGIGSDTWMGPRDTARKPREPWGGKPFSREAARYAQRAGGSVLRGLLQSRARGIEPRRVALVGFSAGNTFLSQVLKDPAAAELVDTVLSLDGMTYSKDWRGNPVGFDHWVRFGKRAAGVQRMQSASNPYKGPLMVVSHTDIVSGAPKRASSTGDAAAYLLRSVNGAYWAAASQVSPRVLDAQGVKQQEVLARLRAACNQIPLPLVIRGGNPPTTRTWTRAPYPVDMGYLGNLWTLRWGGRQGPDHIFQAHQAQQALLRTYLIPRWNARSDAVAGLGASPDGLGLWAVGETPTPGVAVDWTTPAAQQPGGGLVRPGAVQTGAAYWQMALVAGLGVVAGKVLIDHL